MPGYIEKSLQRLAHPTSTGAQHSLHPWQKPNYGSSKQLTPPINTSAPLDSKDITRLQEVIGTILYYARAINSTMIVALGSLAAKKLKGTEATAQKVTQLLDYCTTHPDTIICYHQSDMILAVDSDASYLSEAKARSQV